MIKEYLAGTGLYYDNYLFIDDDCITNAKDINKLFGLMDSNGFQVLHPAIEPKYNANTIIHPNFDTEYRITTWTEISSLFMTKDYLAQVIDLLSTNTSGWGLPELMYNKTNIPYIIYDGVTVQDGRPLNEGYKPLYNNIQDAYKELEESLKDIEIEHKIIGFKLKNLLSFPIIFSKEKVSYLEDCIKSLPEGSEIVLVETIKDEEKEGLHNIQYVDKNMITAEYYYKEWDYSKARNAAKSLSTRQIIFSIDSDERLAQHQHTAIIKQALDLYKSDFTALQIRNVSLTPTYAAEGTWENSIVEQVKIFKNIPHLQWKGKIHETIDLDIVEKGLKYADSNIIVHHIGYETDLDTMIDKAKSRLLGLLTMEEPTKYEPYLNYVIQEATNIKILENKKKGISWH
jgi:hypothetical protein